MAVPALAAAWAAPAAALSTPSMAATNQFHSWNLPQQSPQQLNRAVSSNPIVGRLDQIIKFLSAGVGIIIVGSIIVAGIQYAMGGNQPQVLTAARNRIINSILALFAFLLIFAFLQWIIPGGLFNNP